MQERELRSGKGHLNLKCEVFHHLIRCHRISNDLTQAVEACRAGLKVCAQGAKSSRDSIVPDKWRSYFLFRLAQCQVDGAEGAAAALETLGELEAQVSSMDAVESALLALTRAVAHLHNGSIESCDSHVTACAQEVEKALNGEDPSDGPESVQRMRGHYFLMYAVAAQAMGRSAQLQQGKKTSYIIFCLYIDPRKPAYKF